MHAAPNGPRACSTFTSSWSKSNKGASTCGHATGAGNWATGQAGKLGSRTSGVQPINFSWIQFSNNNFIEIFANSRASTRRCHARQQDHAVNRRTGGAYSGNRIDQTYLTATIWSISIRHSGLRVLKWLGSGSQQLRSLIIDSLRTHINTHTRHAHQAWVRTPGTARNSRNNVSVVEV